MSQIVDLSMLVQLSGNDKKYIYDVLSIFIDSTTKTLKKLNKLVKQGTNFQDISSTAHSMKSGVGIVQILGMLDELIATEKMAKAEGNIDEIRGHVQTATTLFENALPVLLEEKAANKVSE